MGEASRARSQAARESKRVEILRKKMRHQARTREDALLANFLLDFADARGDKLGQQELDDWQILVGCDEEYLMNLVSGKQEAPTELDTPVLHQMRDYLSTTFSGTRNPFS